MCNSNRNGFSYVHALLFCSQSSVVSCKLRLLLTCYMDNVLLLIGFNIFLPRILMLISILFLCYYGLQNHLRFRKVTPQPSRTCYHAFVAGRSYQQANKSLHKHKISPAPHIYWRSPNVHQVKLKFNRSTRNSVATFSFTIRDITGNTIISASRAIGAAWFLLQMRLFFIRIFSLVLNNFWHVVKHDLLLIDCIHRRIAVPYRIKVPVQDILKLTA